ncbi:hypothetical protein [Marinomonas sp. IMCC 4694]|uniref:hypothetical protein n=1 Tax=Marinomonas sp. IMCC 4694 TaxID=2605432 RepID=UPI0011E885A4|nr:hypothetical protein [Marinomonas sp. IMCC 4694]TYL49446.1 hypothetical protein FXV75_09255 [Marinomonas sp. IMCC 4694]
MVSWRHKWVYLPVVMVLWLGLFLDSSSLAKDLEYGQWLTNALVFMCFLWVYRCVSYRVKKLMLYGIVFAYLGEWVFAVLLGMYEYRLENVPFYVPLGHSLVYAAVLYFYKEAWVQRNKSSLVIVLYGSMIVYSSGWLLFDRDVLGFICTMTIVLLLRKKSGHELFFLIMYFMVVYLELLGTFYQSWAWPDIWFSTVSFISSSNPPSGISVFYFVFDVGCLWIYKTCNKRQWARMKALRQARSK